MSSEPAEIYTADPPAADLFSCAKENSLPHTDLLWGNMRQGVYDTRFLRDQKTRVLLCISSGVGKERWLVMIPQLSSPYHTTVI